MVSIQKSATGAKSNVECDALMMDDISESNTYPYIDVHTSDSEVGHEAKVGKVDEETIFYLTSRGITEEEAREIVWDKLSRDIYKRTIEGFGSISGELERRIPTSGPAGKKEIKNTP